MNNADGNARERVSDRIGDAVWAVLERLDDERRCCIRSDAETGEPPQRVAERCRSDVTDRRPGPMVSMTASDEGAGTVLGLMLIALTAVMIVVAAGVGQILVGRSRAATAADLSSLSAANALWKGDEPCGVAAEVAEGHDASLLACDVVGDSGEDVAVTVSVDIGMPFLPDMTQSARAGPVVCE